MKISQRQKTAEIELAQNGIGVTTTARMFIRQHWANQGNEIWARARNDKVNDWIAMDFARSEARHLFKLKSGEVAEIRRSNDFVYIAKRMGGSYVIIALQPNYKEVKEEISKRRMEEWK